MIIEFYLLLFDAWSSISLASLRCTQRTHTHTQTQ